MFESNRGKSSPGITNNNSSKSSIKTSMIKKLRFNLENMSENKSNELVLSYNDLTRLINEIDEMIEENNNDKKTIVDLQTKLIQSSEEIEISLDYGGFDSE